MKAMKSRTINLEEAKTNKIRTSREGYPLTFEKNFCA